ncbi:unnamed protein product [Microthlaspi erraticum]|uniref:F-box domain-containing protein n=1 Tax=Microthlaspi erraticum TaxID=1685480 RepID=A0A6D2HQS0_9BRAS|nr:unnamed protein product [Microthlaspi erraticum]
MEKLKQKKKKKVSESYQIPSDLLLDIFSRVPGKSVGRFRCLSKFWRSKLGLRYFTKLFRTNSLACPRLLFSIRVDENLLFFSSPQPQNPVDNSSLVATRYRMKFRKNLPYRVSPPLSGSVFLHRRGRKERVICNPITGESITLPKKKDYYGRGANTHWVLTLGTRKLKWRKTVKCKQHEARYGGIGINGVLYYRAYYVQSSMIVCFDFSSEKFRFVKLHEEMSDGTLINYKGNLGLLVKHEREVVLWVLEKDGGKHKWSQSISVSINDEIGIHFIIVGMTGAGEIVFVPYHREDPFYLVYYNIERNTFARVNGHIQGSEEFKNRKILVTTFLDYAENMKLL